MMQEFIKYQSLGNDFVMFDWTKKKESLISATLAATSWQTFVRSLCRRHFGIGADGILIIIYNERHDLPEMLVFNADGTQAENCLNGVRCVAHYLFTTQHYPEQFMLKVGRGVIACSVDKPENNPDLISIITNVGQAQYQKQARVHTHDRSFDGHITSIGNPHFVIEEKISPQTLYTYGSLLEKHEQFPNKTNVEFFWHEPSADSTSYKINLLPFERGAGLTLACSTGAAVTLDVLVRTNKVKTNQLVTCIMPGGPLVGWVDEHMTIFLQARTELVFSGTLPAFE